jgi:hypothetical protein
MDPSIITALAALAGAAIGGLMSATASWLAQQHQSRTQWFTHERLRREDLYKEFIEAAAKCFINALQHDATKADIPNLVVLYTKIDRMRILSTPKVVACAEQVVRKILDTYLEPDRSFLELRDMVNNKSLTLLHDFSTVCREEFDTLRTRQI